MSSAHHMKGRTLPKSVFGNLVLAPGTYRAGLMFAYSPKIWQHTRRHRRCYEIVLELWYLPKDLVGACKLAATDFNVSAQ